MSKDSKIWEAFMGSDYAQEQLATLEKKAQATDRNKLYNVDPKNKTELNKSVETMGVGGGGGSLVGSGDSKSLYTLKKTPTPGGLEEYADTVVEGLEDVQSAMMEVALRDPKGGPFGSQDNSPEKWEGLQAAGRGVKPFTKKADNELELTGDEDKELEDLLKSLAGPAEEMMVEETMEVPAEAADDMESAVEDLNKVANKTATLNMLKELVKIANDLDAAGDHANAAEIDAVLKDELTTILASKKKALKK